MTKQIRKNLVHPGVRTGSGANRVHVAATNQRLGGKVGDHVTGKGATNYKGETLYNRSAPTFDPVPYGNAVSASTVCGVGGSRTIYKTGGQGVQGNPNPGNPMPGGDPLTPWSRK
jgi:hypothetical protein